MSAGRNTIVIRSLPMVLATTTATMIVLTPWFRPLEGMKLLILAFSVAAVVEAAIGVRFQFDRHALTLLNGLRVPPRRIAFETIREAKVMYDGKPSLTLDCGDRVHRLGPWNPILYPGVSTKLRSIEAKLQHHASLDRRH